MPVDDRSLLPQLSSRPIPDHVPNYEYGNQNRFVVLTFHVSLISVRIRNLVSESDADLADEVTTTLFLGTKSHDYDADPKTIALDHSSGLGLWRAICSPTGSNRITGWASVEHPEFQSDEHPELQSDEHPELQSDEEIASTAGSIYALFLERWKEKGG